MSSARRVMAGAAELLLLLECAGLVYLGVVVGLAAAGAPS